MVIVFGSINADLIVRVPRLPEAGETVLGSDLRIEPGGKGANQALAAARDGARVILGGAVGDDALTRPALSLLEAAAIDLSRVATVTKPTGAAAITVDREGRNQIAVAQGANRAARASQIEDAILGPDATLLMQMEVGAAEVAMLIRRAKALGTRAILNLAPPEALPPEILALPDILLVNESEAEVLARRLGVAPEARTLASHLGTGVVRTLGADGVEASIGHALFRLPALEVEVLDTTAAGDCFAGVLAAALDRGQPTQEALNRAIVAAAIACTREGSQRSLPTTAEIDRTQATSPGFRKART